MTSEGPQNAVRQQQARNAIERARALGFSAAVSNPCFEYWFLLHFEWCVDMFADTRQLYRKLRTYIGEYDKAKDYYLKTRPHVEAAIRNAKKVFRERCQSPHDHPCDCLPSTQVYRLVESLFA
jgi:hypothetical protein